MIGKMDQRNTWARAVQAGSTHERQPQDTEDDDAAWALYMEEAQQDRLLDSSLGTSTSDPILDSL